MAAVTAEHGGSDCSEKCQKKGWVEGHNKLCKGKKKKKKKAPKRK